MTRKFIWNKIILEEFSELALLNDSERFLIESKIKGLTICQQADELNLSVSSVNRMIRKLKEKYDDVQKYSSVLPKRN